MRVVGRDKVDGEWRTPAVTGDVASMGGGDVRAADSDGVLWSVSTSRIGYIDVGSAVNTYAFTDATFASHYLMSEDRIGWYDAGKAELHLKSRTDLAAAEQVVTLPAYPGALDGDPVPVGDWLLLPPSSSALGSRLLAVDVDDPSAQGTLLASAGQYTLAAGDGSALVTGGTDATDWWVRRVKQAEDGTLKVEKVQQTPAVENPKTGIALSRGSLRVAEDDPDDLGRAIQRPRQPAMTSTRPKRSKHGLDDPDRSIPAEPRVAAGFRDHSGISMFPHLMGPAIAGL